MDDHVRREEHLDVDVVWGQRTRRGAMAEGAEQVEALQAGLGDGNHRLLTKEDHQRLEAVHLGISQKEKDRQTDRQTDLMDLTLCAVGPVLRYFFTTWWVCLRE